MNKDFIKEGMTKKWKEKKKGKQSPQKRKTIPTKKKNRMNKKDFKKEGMNKKMKEEKGKPPPAKEK